MSAIDLRSHFTLGRRNVLTRITTSGLVLAGGVGLGIGLMVTTASATVPNPTVTGPITATCNPNCPSPPGPTNGIHIPEAFGGASNLQEFIDADYTEEEYFFSGTATAYERDPNEPAWDSSGVWAARPSTTIPTANYVSRMLVRRPTDPKKFNGIVVMEWFNVTAQIDLGPDYGYFRTELLRDGFIWVGVSAQSVGVNGGLLPGYALKGWDPVRYESLVHPGDNYCYDIFSQAAQAILHPVGVNPLGSSAYVITGMIADGESQSAGRLTTYVDAIQPLAGLFDGFLIHSRGAGGAALFSGSSGTVPSPSFIRPDGPPVLVFETETDTVGHFAARQPDSDNYRLWEAAGTAHVDNYDSLSFSVNQATQEPFYPAQTCVFPSNMANEHYLMNAAIWHLSQWINGGTPPPSAPAPITVVGGVIQRDQYNNALGGIRLPELDVPTQTLQGVGNSASPPSPLSFCVLYGRTVPLGSECTGGAEPPGTLCLTDAQCPSGGTCESVPLRSVYRNHGKYVSQFIHATNNLRKAGFLLEPDAEEAKMHAAESDVP
jgi:hypothetical protein